MDNRANQLNPQHEAYWSSRRSSAAASGSDADWESHDLDTRTDGFDPGGNVIPPPSSGLARNIGTRADVGTRDEDVAAALVLAAVAFILWAIKWSAILFCALGAYFIGRGRGSNGRAALAALAVGAGMMVLAESYPAWAIFHACLFHGALLYAFAHRVFGRPVRVSEGL